MRCPLNCPAVITYADVRSIMQKGYLNSADFELYNNLKTNDQIDIEKKNMVWCPTGCGTLIVRNPSVPKYYCEKCERVVCTVHECEWHARMTCAMYDSYEEAESNSRREKELQHVSSQEWISNNTKCCPHCNTSTFKDGGCMHMTCSQCTYEYFWCCLRSYRDKDQARQHSQNCQY
jgi:NADH pyrophosphatase NudC (nudix superfamily)